MALHYCARCDDLKAEVRYLKDELGLTEDLKWISAYNQAFDLRGLVEARMLHRLATSKHHTATKAQLAEELQDEPDDFKILDVYIHRIRRRLGPETIDTIYGMGYRLTAAGLQRLADARLGGH